jgi:glutaredoxin
MPRGKAQPNTIYDIYGFNGCGYAIAAVEAAEARPHAIVKQQFVPREKWASSIAELKEKIKKANRGRENEPRLRDYTMSPMVFVGGVFIGGYDDLQAYIKQDKA